MTVSKTTARRADLLKNARRERLVALMRTVERGFVRFRSMPRTRLARINATISALPPDHRVRLVESLVFSSAERVEGAYYVSPPSCEVENRLRDALGSYCIE